MYTEYWNLTKPPFDNVPDSSMYVDCHESMENVISETIFAIKEGNECFAVIFGDVGLGKTLSLRVIIDSLEPEKYKVALITNPALSFIQLLREIIGQITGKQCEEKKKVDLLEIFNRLLFETNDQGQKIVIVIDESNVLTFANLDDLRLLTNMQDDEHNLFTLILAGQIELAEKLEHPKMANLFQRIGTYGHIEKLPSEEALKTYVETRLKLAGSQRKIFTDDAIPVIWEFSEYGTPRLTNKICKLCLKAGETNEFQTISGEVVAQIADRFQKTSKTTLPKNKFHSSPEIEPPEEDISEPKTELPKKKSMTSFPRKAAHEVEISSINIPILPQREETTKAVPLAKPSVNYVPISGVPLVRTSATPIPPQQEIRPVETKQKETKEQPTQAETEVYEEVLIGQQKVKLSIPAHVIRQAKLASSENKNKLAGYWSAQIIKLNPHIMNSSLSDPVTIWFEVKNVILKKFNRSSNTNAKMTSI